MAEFLIPVSLVVIGGALGSAARALLAAWLGRGMPAAWAIGAINIAGSFAAGALYGLLGGAGGPLPADLPLWLFVGGGVLGGFTTVSTFALQVATAGRAGGALVLASALGCPLAAFVGWGLV